MHRTVSICVPIRNPGPNWTQWLQGVARQTLMPLRVLIIDTASSDNSVALAKQYGAEVMHITPDQFSHGGTRQLGVDALDTDIVIFLTQDAILDDPRSLEYLVDQFDDPEVALAYGRQLPRPGAGRIEQHARLFNYPEQSCVRQFQDKERLGMKVAFCSNSYAAYRVSMLRLVGGFPLNTIVSEDMYVAARMLKQGWKIAYAADATVLHSHGYNLREEFHRYFDIGVFNAREAWIRSELGVAESEGARFVKSELGFLIRDRLWLVPVVLLRTIIKLLGYRVGLAERYLPDRLKRLLSAQKWYWH